MSGTTPHALVVAARNFAKQREVEYTTEAKKRLVEFEKAHKGDLKRQHQELQRRAAVAKEAMDGARRRARLAAQNESYEELPPLGRIVGEILRPLLIARQIPTDILLRGGVFECSDLLENQAWWDPALSLVLPLFSLALAVCLPLISHAPTQTAIDVLNIITRVYCNVRNVADIWQHLYLAAYYDRVPTTYGRIFDQAKDIMYLGLLLLYIVVVACR